MKTENDKRAKRCIQILSDYGTDNTYAGCLTDFLTDARHWCDRNDQSFSDLDRRASQNYLAELAHEQVAMAETSRGEFIGEITVILEAADADAASSRLKELARQLQSDAQGVQFADHNGEIEDYISVEAECEASTAHKPTETGE